MTARDGADISAEQSRRMFWVIQTVFSVLLASSLVQYREVVLRPFAGSHWLVALGLLTVYVTALWSWVDYSFTMLMNPFQFGWRTSVRERLRFLVDLLIVVVYAYLLFALTELQKAAAADLTMWFFGLVAVFVLYWCSGKLRIRQHGPRASRLGLIGLFGLVYLLLALVYVLFRARVAPTDCGIQRGRADKGFLHCGRNDGADG